MINAAHELRTPLTVDRTLLQVALAQPDASAEQLRGTLEELLASGREQERLLEALLTLAASERGLERSEPIDLAMLAGRAAGADAVKASLSSAPTNGDPALVELLIANLLDNAIRHNDERGLVEISTGVDGDVSQVTVENTGPVVPASALQRLFEPFARIEESARPSRASTTDSAVDRPLYRQRPSRGRRGETARGRRADDQGELPARRGVGRWWFRRLLSWMTAVDGSCACERKPGRWRMLAADVRCSIGACCSARGCPLTMPRPPARGTGPARPVRPTR